jgi:hypothetical protein
MEQTTTEITAPGAAFNLIPAADAAQATQIQLEHPVIPAELFSEGMTPPEFSRLIVLVPDRDVDEVAFAHKVWGILGRRRASVLFVSLVTNGEYGPGAQRRLITLAAMAQDVFYQIETRVIFGRSWIPGLQEITQPGDLIVCHTMQQSRSFHRQDVPLADRIVTEIQQPVYVLSGLYVEPIAPRPSRFLRHLALWGILIGILGGSFAFEANIQHMTTGWLSSGLIILVFGIELLFIWMWNFFLI